MWSACARALSGASARRFRTKRTARCGYGAPLDMPQVCLDRKRSSRHCAGPAGTSTAAAAAAPSKDPTSQVCCNLVTARLLMHFVRACLSHWLRPCATECVSLAPSVQNPACLYLPLAASR